MGARFRRRLQGGLLEQRSGPDPRLLGKREPSLSLRPIHRVHAPRQPRLRQRDDRLERGGTPVALSTDGRFLVFLSTSGDLFPGAVATGTQVYVYDAETNFLTLASPAAGSTVQGCNSSVFYSAVSPDAAWVAFVTDATDLVPGYSGDGEQVYLFGRTTGEVRLVSRAAGHPAQGGDAYSRDPAISADGTRLAFTSWATDLVSEDSRGATQIYGYDTGNDSLALVTSSRTVPASGGDGDSGTPQLSADGRFLVFSTAAKDLLDQPLPQDSTYQVVLFDRDTGDRQLVSHGYADPGLPSLGSMYAPQISEDGSTAVFTSTATDLVPGYAGGYWSQLYSWSRADGQIRLLTPAVGTTATGSDDNSGEGLTLVADGSLVVFTSKADDLVAGDWNRDLDVFAAATDGSGLEVASRHDPLAPISSTAGGASRLMASRDPLSDDGKVVLFASFAPNLVPGDTFDYASHPSSTTQRLIGSRRSCRPARRRESPGPVRTPRGASRATAQRSCSRGGHLQSETRTCRPSCWIVLRTSPSSFRTASTLRTSAPTRLVAGGAEPRRPRLAVPQRGGQPRRRLLRNLGPRSSCSIGPPATTDSSRTRPALRPRRRTT